MFLPPESPEPSIAPWWLNPGGIHGFLPFLGPLRSETFLTPRDCVLWVPPWLPQRALFSLLTPELLSSGLRLCPALPCPSPLAAQDLGPDSYSWDFRLIPLPLFLLEALRRHSCSHLQHLSLFISLSSYLSQALPPSASLTPPFSLQPFPYCQPCQPAEQASTSSPVSFLPSLHN